MKTICVVTSQNFVVLAYLENLNTDEKVHDVVKYTKSPYILLVIVYQIQLNFYLNL